LVELIWIGDLPVGAHMPIDNTLLAGVGTFSAVQAMGVGAEHGAAVTFALCVGIPLAAISSRAENYVRRLNVKLVRKAQNQVETGHIDTFEWTEVVILALLFTKGVLVAIFSLVVANEATVLYRYLPPEVLQAFSVAPWFLMVTGCAAAIDLLVEPRRILLLAVSAVLAALLMIFFHTPAIYLLAGALLVGLGATLGPMGKAGGTP
jgi:mannose/fructose/N-acetylgalactosamine-specific phosphotransferase system component IIC